MPSEILIGPACMTFGFHIPTNLQLDTAQMGLVLKEPGLCFKEF